MISGLNARFVDAGQGSVRGLSLIIDCKHKPHIGASALNLHQEAGLVNPILRPTGLSPSATGRSRTIRGIR
jgi:hypothetical protein